jgi:hypothetical protein
MPCYSAGAGEAETGSGGDQPDRGIAGRNSSADDETWSSRHVLLPGLRADRRQTAGSAPGFGFDAETTSDQIDSAMPAKRNRGASVWCLQLHLRSGGKESSQILQNEEIPPADRPVVRRISRYRANFVFAPSPANSSEDFSYSVTRRLRRLPDFRRFLQLEILIPVTAPPTGSGRLRWRFRNSSFPLFCYSALFHRQIPVAVATASEPSNRASTRTLAPRNPVTIAWRWI